MRLVSYALIAAVALSTAVGLGSCSSSNNDANTTSTGTAGVGAQGAGGGFSSSTGFQNGTVVSIAIQPADAVIVVDNGTIPAPTNLQAIATMSDGTTSVLPNAVWSYDRPDVAKVNAGGAAAATGLLGGKGTVKATVDNVVGSTSLSVKLVLTSDPQNVDPNIKNLFPAATDPDPSMALLYPYDQTVFPRGLHGPILQWNGGGAADIYEIHAESPTFEFTGWGTVPPVSQYDFPALPIDVWRKLSDSTDGAISVAIQRYDGTKAYLAKTQTWTIAPGNLAGTIYYWEVNNGNVVRLKPGDTAPDTTFLQKPAGHSCVACHSVSKDGSRIVAGLDGGASPWATFNAADGSNLYSSGMPSGFEAISPTGSHVLWGSWDDGSFNSTGQLTLSTFDTATAVAVLNPGGGAPVHPAWSSDGAKVAFAVRTDGNGLDFNHSNLWTADIDLANPAFTNIHQIVADDATRTAVTFPTFSPDSKWIAFERSTQARSRGAQSDISITSPDGATIIALDKANGTGLLTGSEVSSTYEPTFNPVAAGGYFWLVVVSERTYGNTLTDTNTASRHKQLWVTAIDQNPQPGQDPSHPAFWLPGQEPANQNMRGEWALSPCKPMGSDCDAGYECCDGFCSDDGTGHFTCSVSQGCSHEGEACVTAADCCTGGAQCIGGFCSTVPN